MSKHFVTIRRPYMRHVELPPGGFAHGQAPHVVGIVIHDTESHDAAGITDLQGVVNYWGETPLGDRLGAHFIIDADGNSCECATPRSVVWHCGYNTGRVGIELIGFAGFGRVAWIRRTAQLRKLAKIIAWLHHEYGVPLEHGVERGVCTHADVSRAHPTLTDHTDPGRFFPFWLVLLMARRFVKQGGWVVDN